MTAVLWQQQAATCASQPHTGLILGAYAHQSVQSRYTDLDALLDHLLRVGITELRPKTHQHLRWSGFWETDGAWDLEDIRRYKRLVEQATAKGIKVYPWFVPMALDIAAEAQLAAQVAAVTDCIDADVEPYDEFWPGLAAGNYSGVVPFFSRLRELVGPDVEITLDFPARDTPWEWGRVKHAVELAAPYVDRFALQSYFGQVQAVDAEARVRALGTAHPIDHITDVSNLAPMLSYIRKSANAERLLIWREADIDSAADRILLGTPATGPKLVASVREQNQFDRNNYSRQSDYDTLRGATCSAASLAALLTAYGNPHDISDALDAIRATGDDIYASNGLQNRFGQGVGLKRALDAAGLPATVTPQADLTRQWFRERLPTQPVLCQLNKYHGGGHWVVATHADAEGVTIANSDTGANAWRWAAWPDWWTAMGNGVAVTVNA